MKKIEERIYHLFHLKYKIKEDTYNINIIDNIIFNEKSHLVAKFKEHLITDDEYEFLKRYYNEDEAKIRLKKFLKYYHEHSFFFPNYSLLPESEIIYRNINSKQNIIDNIQNKNNSNNNNNNNNSGENKNSLLFNSKVYNSIIKESTNCLSILSYDKESNHNNEDENKNASIAGINELINTFEKIDLNLKNKNGKDGKELRNIKQNKNLNINIDLNNINNENNSNSNLIYTKKRTPNNSINKKYTNKRAGNNSYYLTQKTINNFSFEKDDINNCNKEMNKSKNGNLNRTKNESGSFLIDNKKIRIYKKITLLGNSARIYNHSSLSITASSKEKEKNIMDEKINNNSLPKYVHKNKTINNKKIKSISSLSYIKTKNLLTEQIPRIKVNLKKIKVDKENTKRKDSNPREMGSRKLTMNAKKSSNLNIKKNLGRSYLYNKKLSNNNTININKTNLTSRNNEKKRSNYHLEIQKENKKDDKKNYNKISFKNNKINLIKNKEEYTQHFSFIINNFNSKLTTYNTSIKFNNNISIYNSNNIIDNKYNKTHYNNSNDSDMITNNTNNNLYEKKITENTSFKVLDNKFMPNKNFFLSSYINNKKKNSFCKESFNTINKRSSMEKSLINNNVSNSNSERISTPFNIRQKKKIIPKLNTNVINQNYKTITMDNKNKHISIIRQKNNNKIEIDRNNYKHLNITSNSISNITNNSFIRIKTESDNFSNNFGKSYIRKGKLDNINKFKKNKNNFSYIMDSNNINKDKTKKKIKINDNELKDIKEYRERKINKIIIESQEQRNEYIKHLKELLKKYNNNTSRIEHNNLEKIHRNIIINNSKK